jgi:hypothetical protein
LPPLHGLQVRFDPVLQGDGVLREVHAQGSQRVLDAYRAGVENLALHQTVPLERAQRLCEHLLRDALQPPAELAEVLRSCDQRGDREQRPLFAQWSPLLLGQDNSAGEEIQRLLPGARVVKAFNTVFADVMTSDRLSRDGQRATTFIAGDDERADDEAAALARSVGFAAVKVGPLSASRYLEAMAHLNIGIAVGQKGGTNAAFLYHQAA